MGDGNHLFSFSFSLLKQITQQKQLLHTIFDYQRNYHSAQHFLSMLPTLKKSNNQEFQASEIKLYHPPKELMSLQNENERKTSFIGSSRVNSKVRVKVGGFRKEQLSSECLRSGFTMKNSLSQQPQNYTLSNQAQFINKPLGFAKLSSNKDLSAQIKLIQKKIRYHKKKLQDEKRRKQQEEKANNDPYSKQFNDIIRRQMQLQGYNTIIKGNEVEHKGFDYLTNPGKINHGQQQPQQEEPVVHEAQQVFVVEEKKFDMTEKIDRLQKHYENNLKKKFERREMFPHYPCKRKTPKLYVTTKTNALEKYGKKPDQEEHMFRVLTKQCTPQQIYPTIPNFAIVKDNLSKNVLAYLTDFKPFIERTKQQIAQGSIDSARQNKQQQNKNKNSNEYNRYMQNRRSASEI